MSIELTDLPPEIEQFIQAKAAEEGYGSSEEYVCALLLREAEVSKAANDGRGQVNLPKRDVEMGLRITNFLNKLHQDGIIEKPSAIPTKKQIDERELIEILGPPLSETVIEDRR